MILPIKYLLTSEIECVDSAVTLETLRNLNAWIANVHGYIDSKDQKAKQKYQKIGSRDDG